MRARDDRLCERVRGLLQDYMDGRLHGARRRTTQEHVQRCPLCHRELAELTAVVQVMQGLGNPVPADHFWPRLSSRLREAPAPRSGHRLAWVPAVALVLVALLVVLWLGRGTTPNIATPASPVESYANGYPSSVFEPGRGGVFLPAGDPPGYAPARNSWR